MSPRTFRRLLNLQTAFWAVLFGLLVFKFFLVARPEGNFDFLSHYKFMSSDSYDWVVNGVYFLNANLSSFRNPALPLVIKLLWSMNALYLLALLNQLVLGGLIFVTFKTTQLFSRQKWLPYAVALAMFWNFMFQSFANNILADCYAVFFIGLAGYFLLTSRRKFALAALGISALFQNFAFFLAPIWLGYIFAFDTNWRWSALRLKSLRTYFITNRRRWALYLLSLLNFNALWFAYKLVVFKNPLYSGVEQFGLLSPHLDSLLFYVVNFYTVFGLLFALVLAAAILKFRNFTLDKRLILLLAGGTVTLVFWMFVYNWNERRFLLYLIPFLYPLFAFVRSKWCGKLTVVKALVLLILVYPTTIALPSANSTDIFPITNSLGIQFTSKVIAHKGANISFPAHTWHTDLSLKTILFPAFAQLWSNREYNINAPNATFTSYSNLIDTTYNQYTKMVCVPKDARLYIFNSVFRLKKGLDPKSLVRKDC